MQVYVYTGEGGGKTTNALGLALRCIGHKKKVVIIQFMKYWKNCGEIKFAKISAIKPYYKIYQFGVPGWIKGKLKDGKKNEVKINGIKLKVRNIEELDRKRCLEALKFTKKIVKKEKPHLLVLDEIILANYFKLISFDEIKNLLKFISNYNKNCNVVLTGRYASKKIIELSDYANEVKIIKLPKKISATIGIQY
ncbi:MAG: cob(I)yrinic acid a,c-diamide adenosyltransferase [Candidatus Pacearchaeota archaeon]